MGTGEWGCVLASGAKARISPQKQGFHPRSKDFRAEARTEARISWAKYPCLIRVGQAILASEGLGGQGLDCPLK